VQLGIFAKIFQRDDLDSVLDAVMNHGFATVQFNMACAGLESMPDEISDNVAAKIQTSLEGRRIAVCGLSATFNTVHPDRMEREQGIRKFKVLASKAKDMGTNFLSLCTGTRNTESMWKYDPQNRSPEAWRDLLETISRLLEIAEEFDLYLGIEPEINNVVDSPEKALQLLQEMRAQRLRIIMDPANIFHSEDLKRMDDLLKKAFDLLGPYISLAHAKDVTQENPPRYVAAGSGILNYPLYIKLLYQTGYNGPIVLHSLSEQEVSASACYVQSLLKE